MLIKSLTGALTGTVTGAIAAGVLAVSAHMAAAAPIQHAPVPAADSTIIQVHGNHRSCELGKRGWHRHNKWGQRRPCRPWKGKGKRPDYCVKVGPLFYCDY